MINTLKTISTALGWGFTAGDPRTDWPQNAKDLNDGFHLFARPTPGEKESSKETGETTGATFYFLTCELLQLADTKKVYHDQRGENKSIGKWETYVKPINEPDGLIEQFVTKLNQNDIYLDGAPKFRDENKEQNSALKSYGVRFEMKVKAFGV
jgi:hypothetical protein